jgi:hypothetical protein
MTNAWGGRHLLDLTAVVVTHQRPEGRPEDDEDFVFVTNGIEDAWPRPRNSPTGPLMRLHGQPPGRGLCDSGRTARWIKRRGTLAHDPWSEPHLPVETVDPWTIRLDGRARLAEARLGQPTYRPQWRRRSWAGFGAGNQWANGRAFMR